jgi:membrane protein implicated in regulation of membrane protease activity
VESRKLIVIGLVLVVLGVVGPALMVLELAKASFWLSLFSFAASTIGLIVGMMGAAFYARERVRDKE